MGIKTVRAIISESTINTKSLEKKSGQGSVFKMNEANKVSRVIDVFDHPKRLVGWDLQPGDKVLVNIVRISGTGEEGWTSSDDCCSKTKPPGDVVIVGKMPYKRCGAQVVITDQDPVAIIDDAGSYVLVYEPDRGFEIIVEAYDDVILRKTC